MILSDDIAVPVAKTSLSCQNLYLLHQLQVQFNSMAFINLPMEGFCGVVWPLKRVCLLAELGASNSVPTVFLEIHTIPYNVILESICNHLLVFIKSSNIA